MSEYIYNKNQLKAIEFPPSPLLIIAGAGTGKTTTIVGRINYFLNILKINPKSILALTFTSNAAKHLHNKIEVKNNLENENINATTFHSFAQSQTNKYYKELSYTSPPLLMNQGDVYYLLRSRFNEIQNLQSQFFKRDPLSAIKCFYSVFNGFRQNLLTNKELNRLRSNELNRLDDEVDEVEIEKILQISDMVNMYPLYQNWKKELNRVDYGDLLLNIWQLIKNKDNAYNEIRNKYKHIIVDEFQDNNYALSIIIQKLASPENSITVVGDDDQCIYAFRQANISNIYDFKKKYCIEDNEPIALMHNYRSNQMILDIANNIISKNKQRLSKGELKSNILSNQEPKLYIGEANQQMFQIYKNISEFINSGENLNNIAILLRTHSQCLKMKKYLDGFGINSYYHSANIYEQALVKDIVSTIYILSKNSKSDQALFRLLQKEFSYDKINNLYEEYKNSSSKYFLDYLKNNKKYNNLLNRIIDLNLLSKGFNIKDIIWKIMIFRKSYFNNQSFVSSKENKKIQTINQFRQIIESYCKHYNSNDINSFCKYLEVQMEINNEKLEPLDILSNTESVQIMTIHAAKGKEYKHVFIPFLRTGSFPLNYKKMHIINRLPLSWQRWNEFDKNEKELHLEEERRLFYVGITRAMKSLFLFAPLKAQSIFIKELDDKLIKQEILMSNNKELDKIDYLEGEFQSQIQKEIRLENFKVASFLLNAIENISLLKKK